VLWVRNPRERTLRKSYSFTSGGPRHRSSARLLGASWGMSPRRIYEDLHRVPSMRSVDISYLSSRYHYNRITFDDELSGVVTKHL